MMFAKHIQNNPYTHLKETTNGIIIHHISVAVAAATTSNKGCFQDMDASAPDEQELP